MLKLSFIDGETSCSITDSKEVDVEKEVKGLKLCIPREALSGGACAVPGVVSFIGICR